MQIKKLLWIISICLFLSNSVYANDIKKFKIEEMKIGDSALDYFEETQIENSEIDWHNYNYKEYSTSILPGKDIYNWIQLSYKSYDENFIIEGLVGIVEKKNYDYKKCNKDLDNETLYILDLFKNIKQSEKQSYKITYNPRKIYQMSDSSGKSTLTRIIFDLPDQGEIILACYNMDKATNEIDTSRNIVIDVNKIDSFRIDIRSRALIYYLKQMQ